MLAGLASFASLCDSALATWFDAATGLPVHVMPRGMQGVNPNQGAIHDLDGHIRDLYWDAECNTWKDTRTSEEIHVMPRGMQGANFNEGAIHDLGGHIRNLYWQPCPHSGQTVLAPSLPSLPVVPFELGIGVGHVHKTLNDDRQRK